MKELIDKLRNKKINLSLVDGKLKLSYDDEFENDLLEEIKLNKEALIGYLKKRESKLRPILKLQHEKCLIAPNQTKLWAIDKMLGPNNLYNIPSVYSVKGEIDLCMFQKSWNIILNRHKILRTVFEEKEDLKTYQILSDVENLMQFIDACKISDRELQQQITQICEHIFDLQNGPLCLSVLLQKTEKEYVWITNFHHIIFDGWSEGIFLNEFRVIYENLLVGKNITHILKEPELQYKDYTSRLILVVLQILRKPLQVHE